MFAGEPASLLSLFFITAEDMVSGREVIAVVSLVSIGSEEVAFSGCTVRMKQKKLSQVWRHHLGALRFAGVLKGD